MKKLSLGDKIKSIRISKGKTQEDMAYEIEASLSTYQRIERNITNVTIKQLESIAKILNTSVVEILNYGSNQPSEAEKFKKLVEEKEKQVRELETEIRKKDKDIISLQKELLKLSRQKHRSD